MLDQLSAEDSPTKATSRKGLQMLQCVLECKVVNRTQCDESSAGDAQSAPQNDIQFPLDAQVMIVPSSDETSDDAAEGNGRNRYVVQLTLEGENLYATDEEAGDDKVDVINGNADTHVVEFNEPEKTSGNKDMHMVEFNEPEKDEKQVEVQVIEKKTFCTSRNARLALFTFVLLIIGFFFATTDWNFTIFGLPKIRREASTSEDKLVAEALQLTQQVQGMITKDAEDLQKAEETLALEANKLDQIIAELGNISTGDSGTVKMRIKELQEENNQQNNNHQDLEATVNGAIKNVEEVVNEMIQKWQEAKGKVDKQEQNIKHIIKNLEHVVHESTKDTNNRHL